MKRLFFITILAYFFIGCSIMAPKYNTDFNNVSYLRKDKLNQISVGSVTKDSKSKEVDNLNIRAAKYESPYGSYTAYLEEALKQEFEDARLLDQNSKITLNAILLKNEFDASGISVGIAEIEARFVMQSEGKTIYDKAKSARHTWESAFAANTAVPAAQQNYPVVVQKLIGALFSDPEFIAAIRRN